MKRARRPAAVSFICTVEEYPGQTKDRLEDEKLLERERDAYFAKWGRPIRRLRPVQPRRRARRKKHE